jgi:hypothetical protein
MQAVGVATWKSQRFPVPLTPQELATMKTITAASGLILAIDLGKYKRGERAARTPNDEKKRVRALPDNKIIDSNFISF